MALVATFRINDRLKTVSGADLAAVSKAWCAYRDARDIGASSVVFADIRDNGRFVGCLSYNGKIWPRVWQPGDTPLYEPTT